MGGVNVITVSLAIFERGERHRDRGRERKREKERSSDLRNTISTA